MCVANSTCHNNNKEILQFYKLQLEHAKLRCVDILECDFLITKQIKSRHIPHLPLSKLV